MRPTGRFERSHRIRRSAEFRRIDRTGRRVASAAFVLISSNVGRPAGVHHSRLGVTVSRKVGNAVVRNRVKRQIREWFRRSRRDLDPEVDLVVIARAAASQLLAQGIDDDLSELARRVHGSASHA